jgi:hypothetical protein
LTYEVKQLGGRCIELRDSWLRAENGWLAGRFEELRDGWLSAKDCDYKMMAA